MHKYVIILLCTTYENLFWPHLFYKILFSGSQCAIIFGLCSLAYESYYKLKTQIKWRLHFFPLTDNRLVQFDSSLARTAAWKEKRNIGYFAVINKSVINFLSCTKIINFIFVNLILLIPWRWINAATHPDVASWAEQRRSNSSFDSTIILNWVSRSKHLLVLVYRALVHGRIETARERAGVVGHWISVNLIFGAVISNLNQAGFFFNKLLIIAFNKVHDILRKDKDICIIHNIYCDFHLLVEWRQFLHYWA